MADDRSCLEQHRALVQALRRSLVEPVELIETHISTLLLAGRFAYKLRKPLRLDFLDFSTPERRRADCDEELRLNRRTAPQLYLDVLPVIGPTEQAHLGRTGEAHSATIDWALRMARFDNALLLDRLARDGSLTPEHIDALAQGVAAFHAALPPSPAAFGDPKAVRQWARANFDALEAAASAEPHRAALVTLRRWTDTEFARIEPLLAQRRAQGCVREGHGDLHLGNIVLVDGQPLPFDCVEFNAELRHGDVMGDAAFTFMDLLRHGLPGHAWRFISGYVEHGGDYAGLALLPFLAVYRAMVRAKVAVLRSSQAATGSAAQSAAVQALGHDLAQAVELTMLRCPAPWLVLTSGVSGSGKSALALGLVQALGAVRLRSDVERKRLHGLQPTDRPTPEQTAMLYGPHATHRTYARLDALAATVLRAGLNVIVDAAALRRQERDALRAGAAAQGARFALVECDAPEAVLRERVARRAAANRDASDATQDVLTLQWRVREPVAPGEHAIVLDTRAEPAALVADVLRRLPADSRPD